MLTANSGTIKDALQIKSDEEVRISVVYLIYNDELNKVGYKGGVGNVPITAEMAKQKYVVLDILPTKENASVYRFASGDYSNITSEFAFLHKQENFSKSGNYKIRMCIQAPITDDWGKPKQNEKIESNGFFDYNFAIKDAKDRFEEGKELDIYMKTKINDAPVALPASWKEKSATPAMGYTQDKLVQMFRNHFKDKLSDFSLVKFHTKNNNGGWNIQTNDFGIPRYRYSNQWYTVFMSSKVGKSCFYQGFGLRQDYTGGGTYGEVYVDTEPYKYLNCDEMK